MAAHCVLVVDDEEMIRDTLVEFLDDNGYQAIGAIDGRDALDKLTDAEARPCVIVLDLMMPIMDGRAFREQQLADPRLANIPVILLSAHQAVQKNAIDLHVADALNKPLRLQELLRLIHKHCPAPCE